jgi:gamma-glutamyltranspeptidase/glutathione hydrolase
LSNAEFVEPITLNWKGYDIFQCPPNGSGLFMLMIMGMLGGLPSAPDGPSGVIPAHRHIEAARLAYRDRDAFLADPGKVDVPVKKLLSPAYLGALRALISDAAAMRAASSTRCSRVSAAVSWRMAAA